MRSARSATRRSSAWIAVSPPAIIWRSSRIASDMASDIASDTASDMTSDIAPDIAADAVNGVVFAGAGLVLLPVLLANPPAWLADPRGLAVALHLGLFATALPYFLFLKGLKLVPASTSVTLTAAEPLTASLLGVFLLGERMSCIGWTGIVMTFVGVSLLALGGGEERD